MGLIDSLKQHVARNQVEKALAEGYGPTRQIQPDLPGRLARFVLYGEEPQLVGNIATTDGVAKRMGSTGAVYRWEKPEKAATTARARFYQRLQSGDAVIVYRHALVLQAVDGGHTLRKSCGPAVPDWLQHLLIDALLPMEGHRRGKPIAVPVFTPEFLGALMREAELPEPLWLMQVFDRDSSSSYEYYFQEGLLKLPGLADYLSGNQEWVEAELTRLLSAYGKVALVQGLKRLQLGQRFQRLVIDMSVCSSKTARTEAVQLLDQIPADELEPLLTQKLLEGKATERREAATLIATRLSDRAHDLLSKAREQEQSKSVLDVINASLGAAALADGDEETLSIPDYQWPDLEAVVGTDLVDALDEVRIGIQARIDKYAHQTLNQGRETRHLRKVTRSDLVNVVDVMNGGGNAKEISHGVMEIVDSVTLILQRPDLRLVNLARYLRHHRHFISHALQHPLFRRWAEYHQDEVRDLRAVAQVFDHVGIPREQLRNTYLTQNWYGPVHVIPEQAAWPYFAEHLHLLEEALQGTSRDYGALDAGEAIKMLSHFPSVPVSLRPRLMQLALGEGKTHRDAAQRMLAGLPGLVGQVIEALGHGKQEVRAAAARWLGDLGDHDAIPPLVKALKKEKREVVRADMLGALERLGHDISAFVGPSALSAEAQAGLKKKLPKGLDWFPFDALPECRWRANGGQVDPQVLRWWIVLACKLKAPGGNPLITRYLDLLDADSRQSLGLFVLRAFIHQDSRGPTLAEAEDWAEKHKQQRYQSYQQYARYDWGAAYAKKTVEDCYAELKSEFLGQYLGSAIGEKGVLALCRHAPGADAVNLLRQYMRDHYTRRSQIEAMLEALAGGDDPALIQLLLSVARRYRTNSVQEKAKGLVDEIAERNNWTRDELADRTIPTGGLGDDGILRLDFGSQTFEVLLDENLKPMLRNEAGKLIKALPKPRQADDAELAKEAKQAFTACKKELKQVVELQTGRLYEAMCAERRWPVSDWREYLWQHPIVGRLVQRLVWIHDDGDQRLLFRPTEDGAFIDVQDDEVELPDAGEVLLAHQCLIDADSATQWQSHLKDYGIKLLFDQLDRPQPELDAEGARRQAVEDRVGWMGDTFTLRGLCAKRGYQRGPAEDGGMFWFYYKDFPGAELRVKIEFSGNTLPEENVAAALGALHFSPTNDSSGYIDARDNRPLGKVPLVLLSEAIADYHQIADKLGQFDPDWERKKPW